MSITILTESNIEKINDTFTQVKNISFEEKKNALNSEDITNIFLDKICPVNVKWNCYIFSFGCD